MNIYFTYRPTYTNRWVRYDVSYYNDKLFEDYKKAWLTEIIDWDIFIPENRIILETAPWIKSLRKVWVLKCNDTLDVEQLKSDLLSTTKNFLLRILTKEEMLNWVRNNTDLEEIEEWKFLIYKSDWDFIEEDKYLMID